MLTDRRSGLTAIGAGAAPAVIGTGDSGAGLYGESTTGPGLQGQSIADVAGRLEREAAATNTVLSVLELRRMVSGDSGAAGVGLSIDAYAENSDGAAVQLFKLQSKWSVIGASRKSITSLYGYGASTSVELFRASYNGTMFRVELPAMAPTAVLTADKEHGGLPGWSSWTWANADVVALGAVLSGNIKVCTLPAGTIVHRALVKLTTQATGGLTTLTGSVGITATTYADFVQASDLKGAAGTLYGDGIAEVGSSLSLDSGAALGDYYCAAATDVYLQVIGTHGTKTLADVLTCAGTIALLTSRPF